MGMIDLSFRRTSVGGPPELKGVGGTRAKPLQYIIYISIFYIVPPAAAWVHLTRKGRNKRQKKQQKKNTRFWWSWVGLHQSLLRILVFHPHRSLYLVLYSGCVVAFWLSLVVCQLHCCCMCVVVVVVACLLVVVVVVVVVAVVVVFVVFVVFIVVGGCCCSSRPCSFFLDVVVLAAFVLLLDSTGIAVFVCFYYLLFLLL